MTPIDYHHYRFLRQEPPEMKFIPFEEEGPPPLENRYRTVALLFAIAVSVVSVLLFAVG